MLGTKPNFKIETVHLEDVSDEEMARCARALLDKTVRAEKMLDILDFRFHIEDYDLRHSWSYWEDDEQDAYWPGAFSAGRIAFMERTRPHFDWENSPLATWVLK